MMTTTETEATEPQAPDDAPTRRDEAAGRRVEPRQAPERADELGRRLMAATVAAAAGHLLQDVADLPAGTYVDDDGFPSADLIRSAAEAHLAEHPHHAKRGFPPIDTDATDATDERPTTLLGAVRQSL